MNIVVNSQNFSNGFFDEELNEEEKAMLEGLKDPDKPVNDDQPQFSGEEEWHQFLAGSILTDLQIAQDLAVEMKAGLFNEPFSSAIKYANKFVKEHGGLPSKETMLLELRTKWQDHAKAPVFLGKVAALYTSTPIGIADRNYIVSRAKKEVAAKKLANSVITQLSNERIGKSFDITEIKKAIAVFENVKSSNAFIVQSWDEVSAIAETQQDDWFIPNWAEFGASHLFSGREKAGKSTVLAEVIAANCNGMEWGGMNVVQSPFILFDMENREKDFVRRIKRALKGDEGNISQLFKRVPPASIPRPITTDYVKRCIDNLGEAMSLIGGKGNVYIDTFRSAFRGAGKSEIAPEEMAELLYPFTELAHETQWGVWILHHNAKYSNEYSGSTAIGGCFDYIWNWQSSNKEFTGELHITGRGEPQNPLMFKYDFDLGCNVYLGDSAELKARKAAERAQQHNIEWLSVIPANLKDAKTRAEILNAAIVIKGQEYKDATKSGVQRRTQACFNAGLVAEGEPQITAGRTADTFYLTEKGRQLLAESKTL